jgi:PRC-barrel domain
MLITRLIRTIGTAGVVVAVPLATAMAQSQSPPPSPASPPAATQPQITQPPAAPQATPPTTPTDKRAAATPDLVGLKAKSSDGTNLGLVYAVTMEPAGKVTAIGVKIGGFLGFGGHMVVIPDGRFNRVGDTLEINMTTDEVKKLPKAKEQS